MEQFKSIVRLVRREENDLVYVEFEPENSELKDVCAHGMTLPIKGTVQETIDAYAPVAAREMFNVVNRKFPSTYVLG